MTEIKSLSEANSASAETLNLDQASVDFLNFPHKEKFLSEFVIGSNKLKLYGCVPIMSKQSELIKTNAEIYGNSTQPFPLATFAKVLERPMTLIWLWLNGIIFSLSKLIPSSGLTPEEWLHMYRLMAYLGMDLDLFITYKSSILKDFAQADKSVRDKTLSDKKNVETMLRIINLYNVNDKYRVNELLKALPIITESYPDVASKINWIPIYINDKIVTYANRKVLEDISILERQLLSMGWRQQLNTFSSGGGTLIIKSVGPDSIKLHYVYQEPKGLYLGPPPPPIETLIDFIF